MKNNVLHAREYLKHPYRRILIPDSESGTFTAIMDEFPGCLSQGNTAQEALSNLENAAEEWIRISIEMGHSIPEPKQSAMVYSGKIALRITKSMHAASVELAAEEGVSLNQFLVSAIAEKVGGKRAERKITTNVYINTPMTAFSLKENLSNTTMFNQTTGSLVTERAH